MIISLAAKGLTTGEISAHLAEVYGAEVSKSVYPVVFIDATQVKIRDRQVANRPIYIALTVAADGERDILGPWAGDDGEGAKFWLHVLTEIKNRGVADVLMMICDAYSIWMGHSGQAAAPPPG
ncbi:hypothetical protein MPTA5024_27790 [Microbispora sp. ATCC PTA-5024]|nr:hypothetical protein MPTA5024_27790 [Microbispora sp. ATCC PTA-5024]